MKKFNAFSVYLLGKELYPLLQLQLEDTKFSELMWPLWTARVALWQQVKGGTILLDASKRAAQEVIRSINNIVPVDIKEAMARDGNMVIDDYKIGFVANAVKELETVLGNDMPGLSSYMVSQKGIYKTEDLIERADAHFPDEIRKDIPDRAKEDIRQAGKSLAYEVPTACAFHLWRAVESVMCVYYEKLTGKTFEACNVQKNWGAYIKALIAANADKKIMEFLDHIREEYRNPQTHPEENVTVSEAFGLFGAASSAINQIVLEMQKPQTGQSTLQLAGGTAVAPVAGTP